VILTYPIRVKKYIEELKIMEIRFVLVSNCNADCYFCLNEYVGTKSAKFNLYPSHFAQIMYAANTLGVNDCTLTGGESTLRKDLADIT
jgi:molybdenum cofactor biosynthesis enzyme MoaA